MPSEGHMRQTVSLPSGAGHQSPDGCKTRKTAACTSTSLHEYEQAQGDLGSKGHKLAPKIGEVFLDFLALLVLLVEHAARDLYSIPRTGQSAPDIRLVSFELSSDASRLNERPGENRLGEKKTKDKLRFHRRSCWCSFPQARRRIHQHPCRRRHCSA